MESALGGKIQKQTFPQVFKSRKDHAIRTFPQPRRRRVFGYIPNVSTVQPRVTFLNGLARSARFVSVLERPHWQAAQGGGDSLLPARPQKDEELF